LPGWCCTRKDISYKKPTLKKWEFCLPSGFHNKPKANRLARSVAADECAVLNDVLREYLNSLLLIVYKRYCFVPITIKPSFLLGVKPRARNLFGVTVVSRYVTPVNVLCPAAHPLPIAISVKL
jgi:hypothetical protein